MNLRHFHRSNTEEYQRELRELFAHKLTLAKSLIALINEHEKLIKAKLINDTYYPDEVDVARKTPHPTKKHLVAKFGKDKKPTWTYNERTAKDYEDNLQKLLNGERVLSQDKQTLLPNNLKTLTPENIELLKDHVENVLMKDPDRHVISANTDPTKPEDHMEVRVRHAVNALTGRDGYELRNTPTGGFEIYAPRHSQSSKAQDIATHWFFHPSKKRFKSKRIYSEEFQKSFKALTTKYKELQKSLKCFKNMPKRDIVGGDYEKPTNERRRNEEVGSGPRLRKTNRGSRANLANGRETWSSEDVMGKNSALADKFKKFLKHKKIHLKKTRGTLTFPKILPKDTRPEENVKQIPKNEPTHEMKHGLWDVQPAKEQFMQAALTGVPATHKYFESENVQRALQSGMVGAYIPKTKQAFAFNSDFAPKGHEAIHAIVGKAATHFNVADKDIYEHINTLIHPEDKQILSHTLKVNGYPSHTHHAEYVPWIHTILHNKNARTHFLNSLKTFHKDADETKQRQAVQRLGRTWNAIVKMSKELDKLP